MASPCFLGVLLTSTPCIIPSKPLAAFPLTIVETTDSGERGMNPVAMTIINPQREYWQNWGSSQGPAVQKSAMLLTELWGSAYHEYACFFHKHKQESENEFFSQNEGILY